MSGSLNYSQLYQDAVRIVGNRFEANQLFFHVTQKRALHLPMIGNQSPSKQQVDFLTKLCEQRKAGVPLQYLLGEWEFYGLPFKVGRGVLIPRADTEVLVDTSLELLSGRENPEILDLCSGSGCIAVALAHHLPGARVTAVEKSGFAFEYLEENIQLNGTSVLAVQQDLALYQHPALLDLITCNPPYIPSDTLSSLQPEVWYEPRAALSGGPDGLAFYHSVSQLYHKQLASNGWLCFEVGRGQSEKVGHILEENGYVEINCRNDLNGIQRVVYAKKP